MDRKAEVISQLTGMGYTVVESDRMIWTHLELNIGTVSYVMSVEEIVLSDVPVEVLVETIVSGINKHIVGGSHENH